MGSGERSTEWTLLSTCSTTPVSPEPPRPGRPLPQGAPAPDVPPMSMALRLRALMMFTMMELAEGL